MKLSDDSENSEDYRPARKKARVGRRYQRRKSKARKESSEPPSDLETGLHSLFSSLCDQTEDDDNEKAFEDLIEPILPEYLVGRDNILNSSVELDDHGKRIRRITRAEVSALVDAIESSGKALYPTELLTLRKLKLSQRAGYSPRPFNLPANVTLSAQAPEDLPDEPSEEVLCGLQKIRSTPYENSFLSRLYGTQPMEPHVMFSLDWETSAPWMDLMSDVREHYMLSHPERYLPPKIVAPIIYTCLQERHLDQVHDILERSFWDGINVRDSLDYSPERCTVVVTYKKLVVGVAIMSSPRETYIPYLAVRAGWENAHIATTMLYHLINLNPYRDITLHVSANNPAMLLYNRFGFKAEEFVAGFYEDYLDPDSRASKNAFRLRLRRQ